MPAPLFSNNDSDVTQVEGLYIQERVPPAEISGVGLNDVVVVAETIRGPIGQVVTCGSAGRVNEVFGGRDQGSGGLAASNLYLSLINKPFSTLRIIRVAAAAATEATGTISGGVSASGTIQDVAKASHVDAEIVTISDGTTSTIFEYDVTGNGVTGGHVAVNISGAVSAADVGAILAAAINAQTGFNISAVHAGSGLVNLLNDNPGTAGNVGITTTVASGSYTHSGMAGGTASGTPIATLAASSVGQWGNLIGWTVQTATDGNSDHFNLVVNYLGGSTTYANLDFSGDLVGGANNALQVLGDDAGNLVVLTKLASGVPTAGSGTLSGGSDGSVADSDYTASGGPLELAANQQQVGAVFVAERMDSSIKAKMTTLSSTASTALWLIGPDNSGVSSASAITEAASYRSSSRIVYTFNHTKTLDGNIGANVVTSPVSWLASVLSQIDVDIHPGDNDNKPFLAGITGLVNPSLQRADYIALKKAGICALEADSDGYGFVSGVTTNLSDGDDSISLRRMRDYLEQSMAKTYKNFVRKKNVSSRRNTMRGLAEHFLDDLAANERIVDRDPTTLKASYSIDQNSVNTTASRSQGIERVKVKVKVIAHMLFIVLIVEAGTNVSVTSTVQAA